MNTESEARLEMSYVPHGALRGKVVLHHFLANGDKVTYTEDDRFALRSEEGKVFGWVDRTSGAIRVAGAPRWLRHQMKRKGRPGWKHIKPRSA